MCEKRATYSYYVRLLAIKLYWTFTKVYRSVDRNKTIN